MPEESSIKDCAKALYTIFYQTEPEYFEGSCRAFKDSEEDGSVKEVSFILQELEWYLGTKEAVIQKFLDKDITPNSADMFFENFHYEI